jgi:hypothetical protein
MVDLILPGSTDPALVTGRTGGSPPAVMPFLSSRRIGTIRGYRLGFAGSSSAVSLNPGAILVAHSLACSLVAQFAAASPESPVGGALLVAAGGRGRSGLGHTGHRGLWPDGPGAAAVPLDRGGQPRRSLRRHRPRPHFAEARAPSSSTSAPGGTSIWTRVSARGNLDKGFGPWPDGLALAARLQAAAETARRRRLRPDPAS